MRITELDVDDPRAFPQDGASDDEYQDISDGEYITEEELEEDDFESEVKDQIHSRRRQSFGARVMAALKPRRIRSSLSKAGQSLMSKSYNATHTIGNLAWIFTTSMLLVGLPILYAYDREKNSSVQAGPMLPLDANPESLAK